MPTDSGILPSTSSWPWYLFFVEHLRYATRAHTFGIQNKDSLDDSSLFRNDRSFTRLTDEIAIPNSTSSFPGKNTASLAPFHLLTQVTDKLLSDHAHHRDVHLTDFTQMDCEQSYPGKAKLFV
nr:hypothetical protein [uncultured Roseobacter sp.]